MLIGVHTQIVYMPLEVHTETETGVVYTKSEVSVYVHNTVDDPLDAAQQTARLNGVIPDGTVRFDTLPDESRTHADRAVLLALIIDEVGLFEFRHEDVSQDSPDTARIPVQVAASGKAATSCYLAVHGLANPEIADLLNVGNRTVSQYISDFRKGER